MSVTFFTDRDLGKQFPTLLREANVRVEVQGIRYKPNERDAAYAAGFDC